MTENIRSNEAARSIEPGPADFAATAIPSVALLSNGQYSVMITTAGSGYSKWRDFDVTRWREDATRDCWGQFCYVRDLTDDTIWSIGYQPLCGAAHEYECEFHGDKAEFHRRNGDVETRWAVCVAPDADCEVRAMTLVNHGGRFREIELTSFVEICLNHRRADQAHPAFAKLFLETEFDPRSSALLVRRRPRGATENPAWAIHVSVPSVRATETVEYETDRATFLGRGRTAANPTVFDSGAPLSRSTGPVLDPVFSLRRRVRLAPGTSARVAFVTGAADTREAAMRIAEQFLDSEAIDSAFGGAHSRCQDELRDMSLTFEDVALFNRLAASVLFTNAQLRPPYAVATNRLGQSGLWPHSISGDLPIVLVHVAAAQEELLVRQLLQWRTFARRRGLVSDLVILDQRAGEAVARLRTQLSQTGGVGEMLGKPGGVFLLGAAEVSAADALLLAAAARVVFRAGRGSLATQLNLRSAAAAPLPPQLAAGSLAAEPASLPAGPPEGVSFWNGIGGFTQDGREYVILIDGAAPGGPALPPAPWANVLANPGFGCLVTEAGLGCSWAGNSQMHRLTPWSNDPTSDPSSEAIYLRDEETGEVWTPTPLPRGPRATVTVRHGQGYTRYTHVSRSLDQDLLVLVPPDDAVKLVYLTVRNHGERTRHLSATFYAEWVLGSVRELAPLQVVSELDPQTGAVLARNAWAGHFAEKIAFLAADPAPRSVTADRTEFLGRNGSLSEPAALGRLGLSGHVGPALDPCAAVMTDITLAPGQTTEVVFVLGEVENRTQVRDLVRAYAGRAKSMLTQVQQQWDQLLSTVQVATPDAGMNLMINRWLLYQVLACRVWARSAFYQSGGAYGFRDQLQDVMALVISAPHEARAQILRAAARQFDEGDVQHWWHPPSGIGVRTRITDDLYFLPFVAHYYVTTTGDTALLDEVVPFITSAVLREDQEEDFNLPKVSEQTGTLYDHCLRALEHGYRLGAHGLPLIGTGDWNDGMNKVGAHGKGESVWNGWFFVTVLNSSAKLAEQRGDTVRAKWCRERAESLRAALEANAWDGGWYRRAYYDDGTPLGSAQNDECQIDAIPQAWAVVSGVANPTRAQLAMDSVEKRLVRVDDKLIQLFTPPFDKGTQQPGYIKGYVPGIRENGGQYTHAATWVVLATALQGRGDFALKLWDLITPLYHATTPAEVARYKVEPYVVCADVYGAPPHTGRGGWTWYTGSASWLYRVALEAILGFRLESDTLRFEPCVPASWPGFDMTYRHRSATYQILVDNSARSGRGVRSVELDGQRLPNVSVPLSDDGKTHKVRVELG
jgi:cellobiose phosphorylase